MSESRSVVGSQEWRGETECIKGTSGDNRNILRIGCGGYMLASICQNSSKWKLKMGELYVNYSAIKLIVFKLSLKDNGNFKTCLQYCYTLLLSKGGICILPLESGLLLTGTV